jgi:hypothetical protein
MKEALPMQHWNFVLVSSLNDTWFLYLTTPIGEIMLRLLLPVVLEGPGWILLVP